MPENEILIERHSFFKEISFRVKSAVLIASRSLRNTFLSRPKRFGRGNTLKDARVIAFSETDLWSSHDNEENWVLTAGKVQNLRIAARRLNGIEVPANGIFSFWAHVGIPHRYFGYVVGREIREGCIVPTIAGGLCQLSNALYDAALKAGFEIVERHKHTRVIKGSLAEQDRDATVKWNYIDLRFRSRHAFRIDIDITAEKLVVTFRSTSKEKVNTNDTSNVIVSSSKLNDCYSCGNFECFKHPGRHTRVARGAVTTYVLDERWNEYEHYIKQTARENDHFIVPFHSKTAFRIERYTWSAARPNATTSVAVFALFRSLMVRILSKTNVNVFASSLNLDRSIAKKIVRHIPVESTHLVISQNLLPFIWEEGALGGRTFDVLMTRLPMETLHQRLDTAHDLHPESVTLNDFRAPGHLVVSENVALTKARYIITPHSEIAAMFVNKSVKLEWTVPKHITRENPGGSKILFPASAIGRKGAYEIRRLACELDLSIVVLGNALEDPLFWNGMAIEKAGADPFAGIGLVVYPAYVEHQPRFLLKAIALGVPVITTTACGLTSSPNVVVVPIGDYEALKSEVVSWINNGVVTGGGFGISHDETSARRPVVQRL